jgi:hypothetical protein
MVKITNGTNNTNNTNMAVISQYIHEIRLFTLFVTVGANVASEAVCIKSFRMNNIIL